jgi:hypothetical protein
MSRPPTRAGHRRIVHGAALGDARATPRLSARCSPPSAPRSSEAVTRGCASPLRSSRSLGSLNPARQRGTKAIVAEPRNRAAQTGGAGGKRSKCAATSFLRGLARRLDVDVFPRSLDLRFCVISVSSRSSLGLRASREISNDVSLRFDSPGDARRGELSTASIALAVGVCAHSVR